MSTGDNMSKIEELSETEQMLYDMLKEAGGSLFYKEALAEEPKLMGAVGKLVSKHIAKIERDLEQTNKKRRKKLVLV